jgi:hypothetical protein
MMYYMIKKLAAVIVLVMTASIFVAGCTTQTTSPTATPTPTTPANYNSYFNTGWGAGVSVEQPFINSTNARGNDVYKGTISSDIYLPSGASKGPTETVAIELTKSKAEAKQLYDQIVAQRINEGFAPRPTAIAMNKAAHPDADIWVGLQGYTRESTVSYEYNNHTSSWLLITHDSG